jgi:superfamily I DNA/RNA helicase
VVRELEQDGNKIPLYDLIVVDEYQDFNALEVRLIDLLGRKNQILIVGDDDQALYTFKNASPTFLRDKYHDPNYENFDLPYCNRCPQVIVESVSNIIREAQRRGYLEGRINKPFECYLPDKQEDSRRFPKLKTVRCSIHTKVYPYVAKYIRSELGKIPLYDIVEANQEKFPCVLIVGRNDIIRDISKSLDDPSYTIDKPKQRGKTPSMYDAFKFLIENEKSNLGWRILLQVQYHRILKKTITACGWEPLFDHMPSEIRGKVDDVLTILIRFRSGMDVGMINERVLIDYFKADLENIKQEFAERSETANSSSADSKQKNLTIKMTTFEGCKGLEANHVFILGLNDEILPSSVSKINDREICQLIVSMTRTRKQCHLISFKRFRDRTYGKRSTFLNWIASQNKEDIPVDKNYF